MSVTITKHSEEYLPKLCELASEFYNKNKYTKGRGWLNTDLFTELINRAGPEGDVFFRMFLKENECVGFFIGFMVDQQLFNLRLAVEQGFYSRKSIGLKNSMAVISEFEDWAKSLDADFVVMSAMAETKASLLYERKGYELSETAYTKKV